MFGSMRSFAQASKTEHRRVQGICSPGLTLESLENRLLLDNGLNASLSFGDLRLQDPTAGETTASGRLTTNSRSMESPF